MPRTRIIIQVFVASPSDVTAERMAAQNIVAELNRGVAPQLGVMLELVRWEDVVPGMGRPEQVILDEVSINQVDVFVGVLWNRFGTPTGKTDSGTEEEFDAAYEAWTKYGAPRILIYLCQRASNFERDEELQQKALVLAFRRRVSQLGLLREYMTVGDFESALRQDLTKHLFGSQATPAAAGAVSNRPVNESLQVYLHRACPTGMIRIPSGIFYSGRSLSKAHIDYDFYIDEAPVTNREFFEFVEHTGFMKFHPSAHAILNLARLRERAVSRPDHPVTMVTWYEAQAYATWVGKRLPTSLEWERVARGKDGRMFPWGDHFEPANCNSKESGLGTTTPVRAYAGGRSEDGCFDMAGNVFEWTQDWAHVSRFSSAPNSEKVNRGGSYNRTADSLVGWYEESDPPDLRMEDVGFRCAWAAPAV